MRNRAKCKKCGNVVESFHSTDLIYCKCGQIGVDGGDAFRCYAEDWSNFIRLDDLGNEIKVKVKDETKEEIDISPPKPDRENLLEILNEMIKSIENLPPQAMNTYVTQYDLYSFMLIVQSILKSEE